MYDGERSQPMRKYVTCIRVDLAQPQRENSPCKPIISPMNPCPTPQLNGMPLFLVWSHVIESGACCRLQVDLAATLDYSWPSLTISTNDKELPPSSHINWDMQCWHGKYIIWICMIDATFFGTTTRLNNKLYSECRMEFVTQICWDYAKKTKGYLHHSPCNIPHEICTLFSSLSIDVRRMYASIN